MEEKDIIFEEDDNYEYFHFVSRLIFIRGSNSLVLQTYTNSILEMGEEDAKFRKIKPRKIR